MPVSGGKGKGWDLAYTHSSKRTQIEGWGMLHASGDTMLNQNIFAISQPEP